MKRIQFNINLLSVTKMTYLGPYEIKNISHLMFYYYQILCFSSSNYLNAYKPFLFILTVALWNVPPPQKFCVVYLHFTGYQMRA